MSNDLQLYLFGFKQLNGRDQNKIGSFERVKKGGHSRYFNLNKKLLLIKNFSIKSKELSVMYGQAFISPFWVYHLILD